MIYLGNVPVGIADKGLGDFTRHQRIKVTPSASSQILVEHSLGVIPKLVVIHGVIPESETTTIRDGVFSQEIGAVIHNTNSRTVYTMHTDGTTSNTVANAYLRTTDVRVNRSASGRVFDTTVEYTVDLYV